MCGGCPGGSTVPRLTSYVQLTGIKAEVTRLLNAIADKRISITIFGDQWVSRSRTGAQQIVTTMEALAMAVLGDSPVDWEKLRVLTHISVHQNTFGRIAQSPSDVLFGQIQESAPNGDLPQLSAAEFTVSLVVQASNQRINPPHSREVESVRN